MKRTFQILALVFVLVLASLCIIACNDETDYTEIETKDLAFENGQFKTSVSHDTESYDLISKFIVSDKAWFVIGKDEGFAEILPNDILSLADGDNIFYVKIMDGKHETIYKFNIYRKKMCTINFETNGGSAVSPITIIEGNTIEAPNSLKLGYTLSWDYDFSRPVTDSITINANWTPCNYKISIDAEGTEMHEQRVSVTFGSKYDIEIPVKAGYEFKGWLYNNTNFDTTEEYKYASDINLVASFQPKQYTIAYVLEQGVVNPNASLLTYTIESNIALEDAIWKNDEKRFVGWYTTQTYEENSKITNISNKIGALKLYAKFEDVEFVTNVDLYVENVLIESIELTYKAPYTITYAPQVDEFHRFDGWTSENGLVASVGASWPFKTDIRLDAIITNREYEIEYVLFGGTNNSENPVSFSIDSDIDLLAPTHGNYEFLGWYLSDKFEGDKVEKITSSMAGEPLTLYAKWLKKTNVILDKNQGVCDLTSILISDGGSYELPIPTREKFIFGGWYSNDDKFELIGTWNHNADVITLVANWIPVPYAVTYVLNGENPDDVTQNELNPNGYDVTSGKVALYAPSWKNGIKSFGGWYLEPTFDTKIEEIDSTLYEGLTLFAKWDEIRVTINYDTDNGQISSNIGYVVLGSNYILLEPQKPGYTFKGWYYGESLIELNGVWEINAESVNLVARWEIISYNINYNLNGGTAEGLLHTYNINSENIILPIPTLEGHTFIGWYTNGGGISQNVTITTGSFGDKSYEAKWFKTKDDNGFVYELRDGIMVIVDFEKELDTTKKYVPDIYVPEYYYGYKVTSIGNRAFSKFGAVFSVSGQLNEDGKITHYYRDGDPTSGGFTKIYLPTSIEHIGAYAFEGCNGIKVQIYSPNGGYANYITWDEGVTFEVGNIPARDCIWGFRPALGWSRYSLAQIPEGYDK